MDVTGFYERRFTTTKSQRSATMPSTRRSRRFTDPTDTPNATVNDEIDSDPSPPTSARELRRRRREELRLMSTGRGLSISADTTPNAERKIVFHDESDQECDPETSKPDEEAEQLPGDDSDDEVVEEVRANEAEVQQQKQMELENAAKVLALQSRKRKRKKRESKVDLGAELDEDFFKQLEAERKAEKKQPLTLLNESTARGVHTTFVVEGEDNAMDPIHAGHNIEVVVLETHIQPPPPMVSKDIMRHVRRVFDDGLDSVNHKQLQKAKKAGHKITKPTGWVRSKKMNRLLTPGRKMLRKKGLASAAAHFVVNKK